MQALYQLSYSPVVVRWNRVSTGPPGLPGDDANITRSPGCTTKSFPPAYAREGAVAA
ncbi:hypothetical protein OK074_7832 [Actinobacteria bacterium OK074]|nr:hypothetical protein OK074_7832 [Actinobacteria bacterium OK074]